MLIAIKAYGVLVMHKSAGSVCREMRVFQVIGEDSDILDYSTYLPIGGAVEKLKQWEIEGHKIVYLGIKEIGEVLDRLGFPKGEVVEKFDQSINFDVLIQHNCESIGEENIIKTDKQSIVVDEFGGIDEVSI